MSRLMDQFREVNRLVRPRRERPRHRRFFEPGVGWIEDHDGPVYDECERMSYR